MNESDADYLSQGLTAAGFSAVPDLDQADLAILVTCSVRQNAEQKAYGRFRELKAWKRARPGRAIAISRGYVAAGGIDLVCIPSFIDISIDGEERTGIRLLVESR